MAIKGLIFDLDGTVALSQQFHAEAFARVFKKYGLNYTPEDDARYSGRGAHCTFPEFFKEHGITLTAEQVDAYANEKRAIYDQILDGHEVSTVPGVKNFLEVQRSKGMKIAMATGNRLDATKKLLAKAGVHDYFTVIVTNKDVPASKPAPDIFLKAAQDLGLNPEECIVFEDAVNGVEAAKKAGMKCIALQTTTPPEKLTAAGAERLVHSYDEVTEDFLQ